MCVCRSASKKLPTRVEGSFKAHAQCVDVKWLRRQEIVAAMLLELRDILYAQAVV